MNKLAKILLAIAVAIPALIVGLILVGFLSGQVRNAIDDRKEKALLSSLRLGMFREQFYSKARSIGIKSGNGKVVWHDKADPPGKVHTGPDQVGHAYEPLSQADFPLPDQQNRHPMVEFFIDKKGGLCLWPYDDIKVYFDSRDRVSRWTVAAYQTGC
jgi:hypothetical protein